jgi:hypothetical protein
MRATNRCMTFAPGLCTDCARVQLVPLAREQDGGNGCAYCGAHVRVVPACSYGQSDRERFRELSEIVAEAGVSPAEALVLAHELARATWSGSYASLLETLTERMPGLVPMQVAAGGSALAQKRLLAMLKTVLDALATARRLSSTYSIVADPSESRAAAKS